MSIASELNRLLQAKSDLATSITNKGVTVPSATTIDGYAALVDQIQQGGGLPYDSKVEYLECNGTQYIDTGIAVTSGMNVTIKFSPTLKDSTNNMLYGYIDTGTSLQNYATTSNNVRSRWGSTSTYKDLAFDANNILVFTVANKVAVLINQTKNTLVNYTAGTTFTSLTLTVGAVNNAGTIIKTRGLRIYSISVGNLRDMIPVRVGQVGYMYDRISGTLIGNAGTGSFTLGPDVT